MLRAASNHLMAPAAPNPLASPGSVPLTSGEEHWFLQARIAFFYLVALLLSLGQVAVIAVILIASGMTGPPTMHTFGEHSQLFPWLFEALATGVCLLWWLILRRGSRSPRALVWFDAGGTILVCLFVSAIHLDQPPYLRGDLYSVVMVALTLATRAVLVPSPALRTLAIGAVAFGAVVASAFFIYTVHPMGEGSPSAWVFAAFDGSMGATWVAVTMLTSHTLFGLRQRVRVAMRLGQYTLTEKIGEGGMGVVYKAEHAMLRRPTAVKLLPAGKTSAHEIARFEREVQLTSVLTHPNTIQIYDYGRTPEGTFYYAMEYLDGITLESLVELDGPQPPSRIIDLLLQVCGSLAEAHSIGLIHRDIKPANILVCERGKMADVVKVLDFGLVKVVGSDGLANLSREGTIAGTPTYMSPEAIVSPERVDARSDLYALGAVAYYLATGHDVFDANTVVEVCAAHLHQTPERPSKRLGAPLPADFEDVILWCLAKSPDDRPQDAEQLHARLSACRDAGAWTEQDRRRWWRSQGERLQENRNRQPVSGTVGRLETLMHVDRQAGGRHA